MMILFIWLTGLLWQTNVGNPNQFNNYLVLGYVVMWLIGLVYVISLVTRQRNLQKDMQLMEKILRDEEK